MTARSGLWTQGGSTSAEEDRALIRALLHDQGGVIKPTDLAVAQHGTPNMSVDVSAGRCAIPGTESASLQGTYIGWLDATLNVVISAADATNPRIDLIVAKVQDAQYSGATNAFSVVAVTGTPAASPAAPSAPANSIILAQIAVAALATTIVTANITDKRAPAGPRMPIATSTARYQASPIAGQGVYRQTGDASEGPEFYDGSAWRMPWNLAWGSVATPVVLTAPQSGITTEVDLTSLSITITAVANRRYRWSASIPVNGTSGDTVRLKLTDGAATAVDQDQVTLGVTASPYKLAVEEVATYAAGSITRKLRLVRQAGTAGTVAMAAGSPFLAIFTVEDIGPAGAPS